jgi:PX domain/Domain of unknown function in PX-proteins (DUF3818)
MLLLSSGIRTASGKEESLPPQSYADPPPGEALLTSAPSSQLTALNPRHQTSSGHDINVAGVRLVSRRRHIHPRLHAEFIIRTRRPGFPDTYVARRYHAFRKLQGELRHEFPGRDVPRVPGKIRSSATAPRRAAWDLSGNTSDDTASLASEESSVPQSSPSEGPSTPTTYKDHGVNGTTVQERYLPREKNRLTLRAFLRHIALDGRLRRSRHFTQFLLRDPITLSVEEEMDVERRQEMDRLRLAEQGRFVEESKKRARELDRWLREFKSDLIQNRMILCELADVDALTKLFEEIKVKENIKDLSPEYQKICEWAKIE